jgi:hypothetical protein
MPGLRRPTPRSLVLDLTKQLAEDYDSIPLPTVTRVVRDAVATTTGPDGQWDVKPEGIPAVITVIEHLAREDLEQLRAERGPDANVKPAASGRAPRATRPRGPRRGVASRG